MKINQNKKWGFLTLNTYIGEGKMFLFYLNTRSEIKSNQVRCQKEARQSQLQLNMKSEHKIRWNMAKHFG